MRVMVTGSRDWFSWLEIEAVMYKLSQKFGTKVTIVHGDARGADKMCAWVAKKYKFNVEPHPADWKLHGRRAGYIRNVEMAESDIDLCVAFWLDDSKGTRHGIKSAHQNGIPVVIYRRLSPVPKNRKCCGAPSQSGHFNTCRLASIETL